MLPAGRVEMSNRFQKVSSYESPRELECYLILTEEPTTKWRKDDSIFIEKEECEIGLMRAALHLFPNTYQIIYLYKEKKIHAENN